MNNKQSLLNIYNKMISSNVIEKNTSQEKLVFDLEALKQKVESSEKLKQKTTGRLFYNCLLYTSPSPRDRTRSRMPSSA